MSLREKLNFFFSFPYFWVLPTGYGTSANVTTFFFSWTEQTFTFFATLISVRRQMNMLCLCDAQTRKSFQLNLEQNTKQSTTRTEKTRFTDTEEAVWNEAERKCRPSKNMLWTICANFRARAFSVFLGSCSQSGQQEKYCFVSSRLKSAAQKWYR